jgi:hypothetical protein
MVACKNSHETTIKHGQHCLVTSTKLSMKLCILHQNVQFNLESYGFTNLFILGFALVAIFLVVLNCDWKMTCNLLLEVFLVATSLTMLFKVFNLIQDI